MLLLLAGLAWGVSHPATSSPAPGVVGRTAPDFVLRALDGRVVRLSDLRGTPVVVNFWASWCVPCRTEAPVLNHVAAARAGQVQFLGVDMQETPAAAQAYQDEIQSPYPVGPLNEGSYLRWGVVAPPETYIVDRQGIVKARYPGPIGEAVLNRDLELI